MKWVYYIGPEQRGNGKEKQWGKCILKRRDITIPWLEILELSQVPSFLAAGACNAKSGGREAGLCHVAFLQDTGSGGNGATQLWLYRLLAIKPSRHAGSSGSRAAWGHAAQVAHSRGRQEQASMASSSHLLPHTSPEVLHFPLTCLAASTREGSTPRAVQSATLHSNLSLILFETTQTLKSPTSCHQSAIRKTFISYRDVVPAWDGKTTSRS